MKLKNKKTGEIGELQITEKHCAVSVGNGTASCGIVIYSSLAELNEEWEDVSQEPKEYWYISDFGFVFKSEINEGTVKSTIEEMKSIGNYFETEEEAEKAVERLRAWKRLKDKGFRFHDFSANAAYFTIDGSWIGKNEFAKDMDLLFGGEE